MTDKPAAVRASYADLKLIKTRSVAQIILEVPIEQVKSVVDALGFPLPSAETHVAVARLDMEKAGKPEPDEERKPNLTAQAAMCCEDAVFRRFIEEEFGGAATSPEMAAARIRGECHVESRSEFNNDPVAAKRWRDLHAEFEAWKMI